MVPVAVDPDDNVAQAHKLQRVTYNSYSNSYHVM